MAIVSKQTNETVELFNVPDDQLKAYQVESVSTKQGPHDKDLIELYKMEYERCAQRYDDLYKAAWTNFSYIALIAGAILTFGSNRFMPELSISLAGLPLLFWWLASFETLNRYGDQVQNRLVEIEDLINELEGFINNAPKSSCPDQQKEREKLKGLRHYQQFHQRQLRISDRLKFIIVMAVWISLIVTTLQVLGFTTRFSLWFLIPLAAILLIIWFVRQNSCNPKWSHVLRVRFVVRIFAGAVIIVAACSAYRAYTQHTWWHENYILRGSAKSDIKLP